MPVRCGGRAVTGVSNSVKATLRNSKFLKVAFTNFRYPACQAASTKAFSWAMACSTWASRTS